MKEIYDVIVLIDVGMSSVMTFLSFSKIQKLNVMMS